VESLPSKRRILKKRGQRLKREKRGETSVEMLQVLKKKERGDEIYKMLGETLSKERKKERRSQFPIVQNLMCGLIHTSPGQIPKWPL
jgi:hypothetical protein